MLPNRNGEFLEEFKFFELSRSKGTGKLVESEHYER